MAASGALHIRVLGELELARGDDLRSLPRSRKARALLGYLLLSKRAHRRERLCSLLWDGADDPRGALRWSLSKLRKLVDDPDAKRIVADRESVKLEAGDVEVDWFSWRRLGDRLDRGDEVSTGELESAVLRWRGELLEGIDLYEFDEFQSWCVSQRFETHAMRVKLLRELVDRLAGEPERAVHHALTLVQAEPIDEAARLELVRLFAAMGRTDEAIAQIDVARRTFAELGAAEPRSFRELEVELRSGARAFAAPDPEPAPAKPAVIVPPSPLARTTVHGLRMVGRRAEVGDLAEEMDRVAAERRARFVLVNGEPGVGKSRFLVELMIETRKRRGVILEGCAYEAEATRPYGPWIDALRRMDHELISDPSSPLAALVDDSSETAPTRDQLFQSVSQILCERAAKSPPMLVALDDLQWFDELSAELLHYLVRAAHNAPVLIAVTARGGELDDNPSASQVVRSLRRQNMLRELSLGPLELDEIGALVAMVQKRCNPGEVFAESGGNPLFALELARSSPRSDGAVAPSIGYVVRDRLERLAPTTRDILRWAAVLGPIFRVADLEKLVGVDLDELAGSLEELETHSLIGGVIDLESPGGTYQFAHHIVRRAVYGELSVPRKRLMHARIVEIQLAAAGDDTRAAEIVHHALEAGDAARAASAAIRAARHCLRLYAYGQALSLARRGIRCANMLDEPERGERVAELEALAASAQAANEPAAETAQ